MERIFNNCREKERDKERRRDRERVDEGAMRKTKINACQTIVQRVSNVTQHMLDNCAIWRFNRSKSKQHNAIRQVYALISRLSFSCMNIRIKKIQMPCGVSPLSISTSVFSRLTLLNIVVSYATTSAIPLIRPVSETAINQWSLIVVSLTQ